MTTLYKDLNKPVKDILGCKTYKFEKTCKVSSKASNGAKFEASVHSERDGKPSPLVRFCAKFNRGNVNFKKVEMDTEGKLQTEAELVNPIDNVTVTSKFVVGSQSWNKANPNKEETNLGVVYKQENMNAALNLDVLKNEGTLVASSVVGVEGFLLGAEAKVNRLQSTTSKPTLDDYSISLGYKTADFSAISTISRPLADGAAANLLSGSFLHDIDANTKWGAMVNQTKAGSMDIKFGGQYHWDRDTSVSAMCNSQGVVSTKYSQYLRPNVRMDLFLQLNSAKLDQDQKFGLSLGME